MLVLHCSVFCTVTVTVMANDFCIMSSSLLVNCYVIVSYIKLCVAAKVNHIYPINILSNTQTSIIISQYVCVHVLTGIKTQG